MTKDDRQKTAHNWRPDASAGMLLARALMLKNIRAFFDARDVLEVETPLLSQYSTTEPNLDSIRSSFRDQVCYLNTSPEYAMKRLLAAGSGSIYQICKSFRDDELGPYHNPEFTMLEWYRTGFSLMQLMDEVAGLVAHLSQLSEFAGVQFSNKQKPLFNHLSYQQAFEKFAGINPHQTDTAQCYQVAREHGIEIPQGLETDSDMDEEVDAWLDWLLMQLVFPSFDKHGFTFLYDYPASQCALAKVELNEQQLPVARRFELFYGEVELANGFNELTDVHEQLLRFQQENIRRINIGKEKAHIDVNFLNALEHGLPECSGVAMGLDRLLMVITGASKIEQVLSFSWEKT